MMKSVIVTLTLLSLLLIAPIQSYSFPKPKSNDIGLDIFYGEDVNWSDSWKSEEYDFNVTGLILRTGSYIDKLEKWKIDFGWKLRLHRAEGLGYYRSDRSTDCPFSSGVRHGTSLGFELYLKREFKGLVSFMTPYIGIGGGFSYLVPRDNQPEWMNSGMLGTFGGCVGANIPITDRWSARWELRLIHTSDPLYGPGPLEDDDGGSDKGRNHQVILFGLTYEF